MKIPHTHIICLNGLIELEYFSKIIHPAHINTQSINDDQMDMFNRWKDDSFITLPLEVNTNALSISCSRD